MIVVRYEEVLRDAAIGASTKAVLGTETHIGMDEVLLPDMSAPNRPIFFTKKFTGHAEYRWQVEHVESLQDLLPLTYVVTLSRRPQIDKRYYLKNILVSRRRAVRSVLYQWAVVEVELGHALTVGKSDGQIKSNKRYVDTNQLHSMPKRRLAIVTQVIERRKEDLVQIIPISSDSSSASDKAVVEVTSELAEMASYRKRSWAICRMIQSVTASRIIAPLLRTTQHVQARDTSFRTRIRGKVRAQLKDALMYGVAAESRVSDTAALEIEKERAAELMRQVDELTRKVRMLGVYEKFFAESGCTVEELHELFPEDAPEASR